MQDTMPSEAQEILAGRTATRLVYMGHEYARRYLIRELAR